MLTTKIKMSFLRRGVHLHIKRRITMMKSITIEIMITTLKTKIRIIEEEVEAIIHTIIMSQLKMKEEEGMEEEILKTSSTKTGIRINKYRNTKKENWISLKNENLKKLNLSQISLQDKAHNL